MSRKEHTSLTPLFINLHWPPIAARIKFKALMFAYRTTSGSAALYLNSLLQTYIPSRSLHSANERHITVPKRHKITVTVHGSVCSFCVRLCGWTRSLCLSALPSNRAPDEVIRTVTGVARLHCLYLAGVSVVRCQIVVSLVVL